MSVLFNTRFAGSALTEEYSNFNPAQDPITGLDQCVRIDKFTANNTHATDPCTLTVHIVPSGDSAGDANKQLVVEIDAGESYLCGEIVGQDLDAGDGLHVMASAASTISIRCNGRLV